MSLLIWLMSLTSDLNQLYIAASELDMENDESDDADSNAATRQPKKKKKMKIRVYVGATQRTNQLVFEGASLLAKCISDSETHWITKKQYYENEMLDNDDGGGDIILFDNQSYTNFFKEEAYV